MSPRVSLAVTRLAILALAASTLAGQNRAHAAQARLASALKRMASLQSVTFHTTEQHDSALLRRFRVQRPNGKSEKTEVSGTWTSATGSGGLLSARFADEELLLRGRRMIARTQKGPWKLRVGKISNGADAPHLFDPEIFFAALEAMKPRVSHTQVGVDRDRPVEIVTISLEGTAAREARFSGLLPPVRATSNLVLLIGGPKLQAPTLDLILDMALFIDPATKLVHRIKMRGLVKGGGVAGAVVRIGGGGLRVAVEKAGAEEDEDEAKPIRYVDGLPKRKPDRNATEILFEIELSEHGTTEAPTLDDQARALLGLPVAK